MNDFMQYSVEPRLSPEQENALSDYGQFYSSTEDFEFLARLRAAKAKRKEIEAWFVKNERRHVANIARGILASVYGDDPP